MDLAVLGYGVVNTGVRDQNRPFENSGFSTFAMGGAATGANAALLDGVPNVGTLGTSGTRISFSPPVDSVVDVKVEAFNVDASYGGFGGGTVEITTKGGTNQLHGSASEFNQVSKLAATPPCQRRATVQRVDAGHRPAAENEIERAVYLASKLFASPEIDVTLTKTFIVWERVKVQFRAESFNLTNTPLFAAPTLTATTASFGTIGNQTNNPRYVQFGLRVTF